LYHLTFTKEPLHRKLLVYGLYGLETVQTGLLFQAAFHAYVIGFGDLAIVDRDDYLWLSVPILTAVGGWTSGNLMKLQLTARIAGTFFVHVFYARRLFLFSNSRTISIIILIVSILLAFFETHYEL